jgi:mitogen-activated protein kinase kinase kinase
VHRDRVYIFEEFCSGGSLAKFIELGRIEDEDITRVYASEILAGLEYLHSKGVEHRDIKPDSESNMSSANQTFS